MINSWVVDLPVLTNIGSIFTEIHWLTTAAALRTNLKSMTDLSDTWSVVGLKLQLSIVTIYDYRRANTY
jgi:hypothetical protein